MQRVSHYRQVSEARVPDSSVYTMAPPVQCFPPGLPLFSELLVVDGLSPGSRRVCTRVSCARERNRSAQALQHWAAHRQLTVRVWRHTSCPESRSEHCSDPSSSILSSYPSASACSRRVCTRVSCARERNRSAQALQHWAAHRQLTVRVWRHTSCPESRSDHCSDPSSSILSSYPSSSAAVEEAQLAGRARQTIDSPPVHLHHRPRRSAQQQLRCCQAALKMRAAPRS
jgi:uncharacterized protein (UPF0548 family)